MVGYNIEYGAQRLAVRIRQLSLEGTIYNMGTEGLDRQEGGIQVFSKKK